MNCRRSRQPTRLHARHCAVSSDASDEGAHAVEPIGEQCRTAHAEHDEVASRKGGIDTRPRPLLHGGVDDGTAERSHFDARGS